jgi:3,4-dihydroxy 2-butanone 4-phosphate synthase / GTP cyclohydrolase II
MPDSEQQQHRSWSHVEEAVEALRNGRMVIVVDSEDRENEGDFVCAAESVTPEMIDFMLRIGRGVLCAPMTRETAERLRLPSVVEEDQNTAAHKTPFHMKIDHRDAGTGVSPIARAKTLNELANPNAHEHDFVRPGHIDPLVAREGGVLRRAGHTEATVDLMKMAGLQPVGVLIEIASQTSYEMASYEELKLISETHGIPIISIEDLIRYRRIRERLISREVEVDIPTSQYGVPRVIAYKVKHEDQEPLALVWGDLSSIDAPLVRMHSSCFTGDLIDSLRCDCGDQLHMAMHMIHREGTGAVVYLPQEGRGIGLIAKLKAYQLQDEGYDTVEANHKLGFKSDMRDYMIGLQILKDLGLSKIRLLTNNPKKADAFIYPGFDLQLVDQVQIVAPPEKERARYMETKRTKMGHWLPEIDTAK